MTDEFLVDAKDLLVDAGATPLRSYSDSTGTWGYRLQIEGERVLLVAKQFDYKDNASFLFEAVQRAKRSGDWLLFYNGSSDSYTVFDADYVAAEGEVSEGQSKTRHAEWREIPMSAGVDLLDFVRRRERPESARETKNARLGRWGAT